MSLLKRSIWVAGLACAVSVFAAGAADEPAKHGVDAADLAATFGKMTAALKESVSDAQAVKDNSDEITQQGEILALLANEVSVCPGEAKWKGNALAVRDAALALAKAGKAKNFADASSALKQIEQLIGGGSAEGQRAEMKPLEVASLHHIMEEVNRCNATLRNTRRETRFKTEQENIVRDAQLLAFLATVIRTDTESAKQAKAPQADFEAHAAAMLKAAADLAVKAKAGDQQGADDARKELTKACAECHAVYRPDIM